MFRTLHLASVKTEEKFIFLVYELFLGLSRGEETFVFGKCYGFTHDHPWIELPRRTFFPPSFSHIALLPPLSTNVGNGPTNACHCTFRRVAWQISLPMVKKFAERFSR